MHSFFRFSSIKEGLIFIAVQSVILTIALFYDYRQKMVEKKQKDLKGLISDIETLTKYKHKC
ncbi:MAG TPA: hypothetical protein VEB00_00085 [Clostridia bacterium]|nr:hypothetical protein [Clostridia bacterium]